MLTPAIEILETRKLAAGFASRMGMGVMQAMKKDPVNTIMGLGNAAAGVGGVASGVGSVAAPLVANMTAPGAPSRGHNQTGGMMPMPSN